MARIIVLTHATLGGLGALAALWVFVELLNTSEKNLGRINCAATATTVFIWLAYLIGGWFYVTHYGADKAVIKAGPWPFAHSFFMEVKEHLFFILLLLATYLPILAKRSNLLFNKNARNLSLSVSGMIVLLALSMEGAGAIISMGIRQGLILK